ncbi:glycosyltransferase [Bacteroides sp.]|uniref:glycosyltransferase family 2 protein n=1 Tax=Bacteroides sp. TaxID=29523 RepID=UPI0023D62A15|nr:glycosyltransferase [Bacteroides sp.]MDE6215501.1 glycosyltransferase [Bacteroides sp.]
MDYKISIIIPIYQVENYISRCCRSLFGMRFQDVEYLFVNDATPDGSMAVVESILNEYPYRKAHVKLLAHPKNMGVASARNTGLKVANGEYIAFVDADDWIEENMFEKLYQGAEIGHCDIVGCDWYLEFETSRRYMRQPVYEKSADCLKAMLSGEMRWFLWAFLVRRDIYVKNNICFLDGANIGEDMVVLIQCFSFAQSYRHISEALYHYVKSNAASMTALDSKKQIEIVKRNVDATVSFIRSRYQNNMEQELDFLKLNVKFPLLISDNSANYEVWNASFLEANRSIWKNPKQPFRNKLLQWAVSHRYYWIVRGYYRLLFRFVYGILYR